MLRLYTNVNTDDEPRFDSGTPLQVGDPGSKTDIDVGARATPIVVDWNSDGKKDVVVGDIVGTVRVFINEGTDTAPDFRTSQFLQNGGVDLVVFGARSSPCVTDLDDDGRKDLLTGNTNGQLLLYANTGTDEYPSFSGYELIAADSVVIDLAATRSRPFVCDWTGDGSTDVLIGASDGLVRLYQGVGHMVGVDSGGVPVLATRLSAAYPNPFNPRVDIPFEVAADDHVRISVYDTSGRLVAVLVDDARPAGEHVATWRGADGSGRRMPSGVYLVRLESSASTDSRKLVLLR
jgi:hypothetical protein